MIAEIMSWWGAQLLSLLPGRGARQGDAVMVAVGEPGWVTMIHRRRGIEAALGRFALGQPEAIRRAVGPRRQPVELRLPPGMLLDHAVVLPLAAERDPGRVLGYEMDRLTPFTAGELFWSWAVERRDRARSQLHVRLALVPRAVLAPVLETLQQAGLMPSVLRSAAGQRIQLDAVRTGPRTRRAAAALATACVLLAIAAIVLPFVLQSRQSRAIEARIARLRPTFEQAEALRRGLQTAGAGTDVVAALRGRVGEPLAVLAALTGILPDDTVLTDLSLRQRVLTISGQAATAARLIPALAADPAFRNPAFTAPVTRNETAHTDGFALRADAAP